MDIIKMTLHKKLYFSHLAYIFIFMDGGRVLMKDIISD